VLVYNSIENLTKFFEITIENIYAQNYHNTKKKSAEFRHSQMIGNFTLLLKSVWINLLKYKKNNKLYKKNNNKDEKQLSNKKDEIFFSFIK